MTIQVFLVEITWYEDLIPQAFFQEVFQFLRIPEVLILVNAQVF